MTHHWYNHETNPKVIAAGERVDEIDIEIHELRVHANELDYELGQLKDQIYDGETEIRELEKERTTLEELIDGRDTHTGDLFHGQKETAEDSKTG